ncbi:type II toxin-antitoxin system VapC family toxin [Kumtagia ephedrae]|uniref:Ribonuclease VapC n=1 Tax=Kumtagia ephedrae TaxID=2116701 RepID=A0A2P7S5M7_9HYPH|nr:type II toxin-antitoxin system VapC family toxin [Mesorhizobium ephedrae]PSJ57739.1 PIN domain nuclease [Mesorhizobium ephedrae]
MTQTIVVDASVVAKWLVPEEHSLKAVALRSSYSFAVPDILFAEVANILWKKMRRGELTEADGDDAVGALSFAKLQVERTEPLGPAALRLSRLLDHPTYDCFYLCLAARLDTIMVTADERLLRKLRSSSQAEWRDVAVDLQAV